MYLVKVEKELNGSKITWYFGKNNERIGWTLPWDTKELTDVDIKLYGYNTEKGALRSTKSHKKVFPHYKVSVIQFEI